MLRFEHQFAGIVSRRGGVCRDIRFFFQAEDGIRDYKVTGVQTCALPIFGPRDFEASRRPILPQTSRMRWASAPGQSASRQVQTISCLIGRIEATTAIEIGRASCRERV